VTSRGGLWSGSWRPNRPDVGCDQALELMQAYVELIVTGEDVERRYPGIAGACARVARAWTTCKGLLAAVRD
jgi:hypothetical protein